MWVRILQRNRTNRIHQIRWDLPGWLTYSEAECTTVAVWRLEESQESQELLSGKSQKPQNKKKRRCSLSWRLKVWETPGRRRCGAFQGWRTRSAMWCPATGAGLHSGLPSSRLSFSPGAQTARRFRPVQGSSLLSSPTYIHSNCLRKPPLWSM